MKRVIFYLLLPCIILLLTGCEAEYNVSYINDEFVENINVIGFNSYDLEFDEPYDLIKYYNDLPISANIDDSVFFDKKIVEKESNNYDMELTYTYSKINYDESNVFNYCVENHKLVESETNIYILVYGEYDAVFCGGYDELVVNLKTDKKVTFSNAHEVHDNIYTWQFQPQDLINIEVEIDKTQKSNLTNHKFILYSIIIIFVISVIILLTFFGFKIYKKLKNNQEV